MESVKTENKVWQIVKKLSKRWFIDAFSGMAQGLFVTLIAGTILAMIAGWLGEGPFGVLVTTVANFAKTLMGAGIGVGIAHALKANKLVTFSAAVMGMIGAFSDKIIAGQAAIALGAPGNPIGAYVVALFTVEIASLYAGKTKLDIILIPLGMLALSLGGVYLAYPFIWLVNQLGILIAVATDATPFFMGIIIAVVMGILLTMPTSSAAIWMAVATPVITGGSATEVNAILLAGGAAAVGCACHMVGFAVTSYRENGVSGLVAQGIGTSMLQIPNIMKKPVVMVPEIVASAICGPLATCVFGLRCTAAGGGMGTSGLVGIMGILDASAGVIDPLSMWLGTILLMIVLPAAISLGVSELFRHKNIIKSGDLKLDL